MNMIRRRRLFWAKVNKKGPKQAHMKTRCWTWMGAVDQQWGYGWFWCPEMSPSEKKSHQHYASRVAWFLKKGTNPTMQVLHHCDNPACVRPSHLFEGDHAANMRDRARKGRSNSAGRAIRSMRVCEDRVVLEILARRARGERATDLAREFGLNQNTVYAFSRRNLQTLG